MTSDHCHFQLARLNILRGVPAEIYEYYAALDDVPDDVFTRAIGHALKTRTWFPTPAELRADVDAVIVPTTFSIPESKFEAVIGGGYEATFRNPFTGKVLTVKVDRIWKFDCLDCEDTGWRSRRCPAEPCGRDHFQVYPHEWVARCECIDWNPTIRRRKEATAKYSQAPEKVGA